MPFIANTDQQRAEMLSAIGLSADQLFADIPPEIRAKPLNLPPGLTEQEARARLARLSERNAPRLVSFLGGGFYDHYVPAAVDAVISRSEFYTAYTPYQPEISQGTLQAIYEYQSAICRLTEMEVSNASLYDGGTAIYEAIMMALRTTGRNRVILDQGVNPIYRKMVASYTSNLGIELVELPMHHGKADRRRIAGELEAAHRGRGGPEPQFLRLHRRRDGHRGVGAQGGLAAGHVLLPDRSGPDQDARRDGRGRRHGRGAEPGD